MKHNSMKDISFENDKDTEKCSISTQYPEAPKLLMQGITIFLEEAKCLVQKLAPVGLLIA